MEHNLDAMDVYDPAADKWSTLESMPSQRGGLAAATINETIYVFGGERPDGTFNNNEKYDPSTNKWTSSIPMPTGRHGLSAVTINDKIYVVGGGPEPGLSVSGVNEIFAGNKTAN
jgi:N-acetylneuraminic acid mutarotase